MSTQDLIERGALVKTITECIDHTTDSHEKTMGQLIRSFIRRMPSASPSPAAAVPLMSKDTLATLIYNTLSSDAWDHNGVSKTIIASGRCDRG